MWYVDTQNMIEEFECNHGEICNIYLLVKMDDFIELRARRIPTTHLQIAHIINTWNLKVDLESYEHNFHYHISKGIHHFFTCLHLFACHKHYDMYLQIEILFLGALSLPTLVF